MNSNKAHLRQGNSLSGRNRFQQELTCSSLAMTPPLHRWPHDEMTERDLAAIVSQGKNIEDTARAVELDDGDNTTAQVIRIKSVEQVGMYRGRPYRLPG